VPAVRGQTQLPAARCAAGRQINNIRGLGSSVRGASLVAAQKNEGVGEHVRTRFHLGALRPPGEIADHEIRTERRKLVSSAGPVSKKANSLERTIQPFDLMSRRHPLSSMEPPELEFASREANRSEGSRDVPASSRRQFFRSENSLLLLGDLAGLLGSLLHCALRLLRLLSFLGHVALRCRD